MSSMEFRPLAMAMLLLGLWAAACNSNHNGYDDESNARELSELETLMGAKFPADAKIIYFDTEDRDNPVVYRYIICSQRSPEFSGSSARKMLADSSVAVLKKIPGIRKLGKLTDKFTYTYEGNYKGGEWRAFQTIFETGSYLDVEHFSFKQ
ncbi:MAG: hypothetical protein WAU91_16700 [Desulfatitalea sp.]